MARNKQHPQYESCIALNGELFFRVTINGRQYLRLAGMVWIDNTESNFLSHSDFEWLPCPKIQATDHGKTKIK